MSDDRPSSALTDPAWLHRRLDAGGVWEHGRIVAVGAERIGLGHGLSGEIRRLHCRTDLRDHVTLVAKVDDRDLIRRAVNAHRVVGSHLGRSKPVLLGHDLDTFDEHGVVLLEDVRTAEQGDELRPIERDRASGLVSVVARVHRAPIGRSERSTLDRWTPRAPDPERWNDTLASVAPRLDRHVGRHWRTRLGRLDEEAAAASVALAERPFVLLHGDPHLDNVLWRPDGSTVLLDWSSARLGPAAVDAAVLVSSLCLTERAALAPEEVIDQLADPSDPAPADSVRAALVNLLRGQLAWMGRPGATSTHPRAEALVDDAVGRVERTITWLDLGVSGRSRR